MRDARNDYNLGSDSINSGWYGSGFVLHSQVVRLLVAVVTEVPLKEMNVEVLSEPPTKDRLGHCLTPVFMIAGQFEIKDGEVVAFHASNDYTLKLVEYPSGRDFALYPKNRARQ